MRGKITRAKVREQGGISRAVRRRMDEEEEGGQINREAERVVENIGWLSSWQQTWTLRPQGERRPMMQHVALWRTMT